MAHKKLKTDPGEPELNEFFRNGSVEELNGLYKVDQKESIEKASEHGSIKIINSPFKCCVLSDFLKDTRFLSDLKTEIRNKVEFFSKNNDLYQFKQSEDFKLLDFELCNRLTKWLRTDVLNYVKQLTKIDLYANRIDITASEYAFTDVLLCHDDLIAEEERRVAFILYLVDEDWCEADGGHLDLFARDENQQPTTCEVSLLPKWNNFAFFEVTPKSFHQVREVLSRQKVRLSVNGWFKGPKVYEVTPYKEKFICPIACKQFFVEEPLLRSWINELYLTDEIEKDLQEEFKQESQALLSAFLNEERCAALRDELRACEDWQLKLPANRRRYFVLDEANFPASLKEFVSVMKSEQLFLILGAMTGLKLHPLNPDDTASDEDSEYDSDQETAGAKKVTKSNPRCSFEVRKFERGCYTLIHDYDGEVLDKNPKLDVKYYFDHAFAADDKAGGCTYYIVKDEDEEVLTVEPENNSLSIVYRDEETVRFEKYLNCTHNGTFYELSMIFQE